MDIFTEVLGPVKNTKAIYRSSKIDSDEFYGHADTPGDYQICLDNRQVGIFEYMLNQIEVAHDPHSHLTI